ncbi:MAG: immunoglobulin domain-containing protein, partial [Verrucomicrobiota bacterium]
AELRGANCTITNLNWLGGSLNGENAASNTVTIPPGGTLNISSLTTKTISDNSASANGRRIVNNGTATWSGAGISGYYGPQLINNNAWTITSDLSYVWSGFGNGPVLVNNGTFTLASGTDFILTTANFTNTGTFNIVSGSLTMNGGSGGTVAFNSGLFNLDANSFLYCIAGTFNLGGTVVSPAVNHVQFNGMTVGINTTNLLTPSLYETAGTVNQNTNVVVDTYNIAAGTLWPTLPVAFNNLNLTNAELRGANCTITNLNWLGGNLNSDGPGSNLVTVVSTLNIVSTAAKSMSYYTAPGRSVINNGNAIWGGGNITFSGQSSFQNNGNWSVTNDVTLSWTFTGSAAPLFQNNGTFTKSAGAGTLTLGSTTFTNSGTVAINSGGITIGGPFVQTAGSAFLGTNFTASSSVSVLSGSLSGKGTIAGAYYNNGSVNPGASPGFISGASFTNTAAAVYNIEIGGNTGAGTNYDQLRFSAPVTLDGTLNVSLYNNYALILSNRFTVLTTSARNGTFANVIPPPGATLNTIYSPTNVVLEVIGLTNAPLQILTNPVSQTIWTPDPVTFSAAVSGVTPISFQWQFNGTNISGATNTAYTIPAVAVTNGGLYTLQIVDGYGGTTNTSATLTVIPFGNTIWWTNTIGGNWSASANWLPNRIPNGTNNVLIVSNGTYTVTVDVPAALSNLTVGAVGAPGTPTVNLLSGQSLTVNGNTSWETNTVLVLNGLLQMNGGSNSVRGHIDWQLGTLSGAGRTVIATNASLTFVGSLNQKFIATNVLENYGTFNYGSDSFGNAQGLSFSGGAQLTNYPSGVISIGTAAYDYSGAQTPRSYLANYGTINANSANIFAPSYISIDFINYGTLQDNGYAYLARGTNYGTFSFFNTLCEVSVFGDETTGDYFSFENGTVFTGAFPRLAVGGYAQWNNTAIHPGRVIVVSGSGGASFANPEFRVLKNYTQSGQTIVQKGR